MSNNVATDNGFSPGRCDDAQSPAIDDGIYVNYAPNTSTGPAGGVTLSNNVVKNNADYGVHAVAGAADGGGNQGSGNGNAAQCSGVDCTYPPGAPSVTSIVGGNAFATVAFDPPVDNGGSMIAASRVTCTSSTGGAEANSEQSASPITINGLTNAKTYQCVVEARNAKGYGAASNPSASITPSTPFVVGPNPPVISGKPDLPVIAVETEVATRSGYWMLDAAGNIYSFGDSRYFGGAAAAIGPRVFGLGATHVEPTPTGNGYWIVDTLGRVCTYGDAAWYGNADSLRQGEQVSSLSATAGGHGYWIFTSMGRVISLGDAQAFGDMSSTHLNGPVSGSIATPTGKGYYMVASDGGIFAFGDAVFYGSIGATHLNAPVQSLVPTVDGKGYWLVASDGGIFAFGDATFRGSMGSTHLNGPVVGMVRYGDGYLMVGADGGIFNFSDQPFKGSLGGNPPAFRITGVAVLAGA